MCLCVLCRHVPFQIFEKLPLFFFLFFFFFFFFFDDGIGGCGGALGYYVFVPLVGQMPPSNLQ